MSTAQNGKGSKNRLKGDSLKAYKESKLWDNLKLKKTEKWYKNDVSEIGEIVIKKEKGE